MGENSEQKQLIQWVKQYPWGQFLFHICNESVGGYGWTVRNRQMGVRKGVPDLCLPIPTKEYHGLFIEMKAGKGKPSEEQKDWINFLNTVGYKAVICNGWKAAAEELKKYMEE